MKKIISLLYISLIFILTSCYEIEEFEPGNAYFTTDNTLILYYDGEYNKDDVRFKLHTLNSATEERKSFSIISIDNDKENSKLIIKYEDTIPTGFATKIYVFKYGKYETAVTVEWPKS